MCHPRLISAHTVTSRGCILDQLEQLVQEGALADCDIIQVDSGAAVIAIAIGASAAGARTYTATSAGKMLSMAEALYDAAPLGLPIVMTVNYGMDATANASDGHGDSMPMRDAGWIQLYAETNQEALDLHVQAFRLAEALYCPVMVCTDGAMLMHSFERIVVPSQAQIDAYLPSRTPSRIAVGAGMSAGPDTMMEMRYLAHHRQLRALGLIPQLAEEFAASFRRASGGLLHRYRTHDAETIVVALGSVNTRIREVVDEMRLEGARIGSVSLASFRPFPLGALHDALLAAVRVVIIEESLAVGLGGILSDGVRQSLASTTIVTYTVIAGLGGRAITHTALKQLLQDASQDELEQVTFLDLNAEVVASRLEHEALTVRHCPDAS
jgi:pyruvate ferredoxin oxidoreductase alpha subunit